MERERERVRESERMREYEKNTQDHLYSITFQLKLHENEKNQKRTNVNR